MWKEVLTRLAALTNRRQLDKELEEELAGHLALRTQQFQREGMPEEEARRRAVQAVGSRSRWTEESREQWRFLRLESLGRDVRFGLRILGRDRAFTAIVLLTLTLGIGANAAIFALINGLLLKALPVRKPSELIRISVTNLPPGERSWVGGREVKAEDRQQVTYPLFRLLSEQTHIFTGVFGEAGEGTAVVQVGERPYNLTGSKVTGRYFEILGVEPQAGRMLRQTDDVAGGPSGGWPAVISDSFWERAFHRSPDAIGMPITVERVRFIVVGVAPPSFHGVRAGSRTEIWLPLSAMEAMYPDFHWRNDPGVWILKSMARLAPGVSMAQARDQLRALSRPLFSQVIEPGLSAKHEEDFRAMILVPHDGASGDSWIARTFGPALWILMAAVGAVLLIAATNLTNLLLARAAARRQEIAVRVALGASQTQVRRQLLVESMLLAIGGLAGGLIFAAWMTRTLQAAISPGEGTIAIDASLDWRVVAFLSGTLVLVVLIAGWAPAWSASRVSTHQAVRQRMGLSVALRSLLIAGQIAMTLLLLGGAGLMISSFRSLLAEQTGFEDKGVVMLLPDLFNAGVAREDQGAAYRQLLSESRRLPGVVASAWTQIPPLTGGLMAGSIDVPGRSDLTPMQRMVFRHAVSDGYFAAMGIDVLAGRELPIVDGGRKDVCIVSENLARRFFGGVEEAIGRRLGDEGRDVEIIGVAANAKYQSVREHEPLTIYVPYWATTPKPGMTMVVRHSGLQAPTVAALTRLFQNQAGRLPFVRVSTLDSNRAGLLRTERVLAWLLTGFAVFAVLISVTGISGLLAYLVEQRKKEVGIRLALGATPWQVWTLFQRHALLLAVLGLGTGLALSQALRRVVASFLFRITPEDPLLWAGAVILLGAGAMAASAWPSWRASRLDPMVTLRLD